MTTAPSHATRAIIETKRIDGKPAHRLEGSAEGAWIVAKSEIDAILSRVQAETGAKRGEILDATNIQQACVSRCRHGKYGVPDHWLQRLAEYSGVPVAELRRVACMEPVVQPHFKARRTA
jgi:hypothetical protein